MTDFELHRRDLLKLIGSALSAELLRAQNGTSSSMDQFRVPADYRPRFLTASEYEFTSELCEIVIPSDPESPGSKEAGVPWFIDTVLLYADANRQQSWRSGLAGIDALATRLRGKSFLNCSASERVHVVHDLAQNEDNPASSEDKFFGGLKALAIEAFCLSDVGIREYLHYKGNVALSEFPGCTPDAKTSS